MPTLHFHRRHSQDCAAGHPRYSLTTESDERKRGAKKCACSIFASGTLNGIFKKLGTKQTDWEGARRMVQPFLEAGRWDVGPSTPPPSPSAPAAPDPDPKRLSVPGAMEKFFRRHRAIKTEESTLLNYRYALAGRTDGKPSENCTLAQFAEEQGIRYLDEFTRASVKDLYLSWQVGPGTRRKRLSALKTFFEMFFDDGDLKENPARSIKAPRNKASREDTGGEDHGPREPFTNDELRRMLEGCRTYGQELREWPRTGEGHKGRPIVPIDAFRAYQRTVTGNDLADFILLSYQTGLRIGDVATFHIRRLEENGMVRIRAQKNHTWVSVPISAHLQKIIRERARIRGGYVFGDPQEKTARNIYQAWYRCLNELWEQTGPWTKPPVHHRFRHTFARILLENGTSTGMVARLIGDTEETVRLHYSRWVPELQAALARATMGVFDNLPHFHNL